MTEFSGTVEDLLRQANEFAEARGHSIVGTEHLLLAMTRQSPERSLARRVLDEAGVTNDVRARIEAVIGED
jgi:ATP-dependent Clp protease ATP-binding subunit ClpA